MKKLILTTILLLTPINSYALILDMDYTGLLYERIDSCGYGCGRVSETAYTSNLLFAGGPVANNSMGYAQQFNIHNETRIEYLLASAYIEGENYSNQTTNNNLYFKLYTGTSNIYHQESSNPYPDVSTAVIISSLFVTTYLEDVYLPEDDIWHVFERPGIYKDAYVPVGITLIPGTYWIAQERYFDDGSDWSLSEGMQAKVSNISVKFVGNVVPEPVTMILLGCGLLGGVLMKR